MPKIPDELTPMMTQYLQIKKDYQDAILFFRLGDFYEMFFDDAKTASAILGLALTSRNAGRENKVPMCGIPYHASENYISRLINANHKVAICEQTEDPKAAKGIVRRQIVRVITPGTIIGQNVLSRPQNNYLVSICSATGSQFGLAMADLSTGEFRITELGSEDKMLSELVRLRPAEIIADRRIRDNNALMKTIGIKISVLVSETEDWSFDFSAAYEKLVAHFKTKNLKGFGCEEMRTGICAAGALLKYLENTQKAKIPHIKKIRPYSLHSYLILDSTAQRNLELVHSVRRDRKATLLNELDFTATAMGKRRIVQWIQQPLLDEKLINERLDGVEAFYKDHRAGEAVAAIMKQIVDIERLTGRISLNSANGRDVFNLNESLKVIPDLKGALSGVKSGLLAQLGQALNALPELTALIDRAIRDDAPISVREGRMIKPGFDEKLDELNAVAKGGKEWLASLQQKEIERTGISSLKIKYNRVFGYYIEVTKTNLHLVPEDYIRKQTLVNAERFITPELKEKEERILSAQEEKTELEYRIFTEICERVMSFLETIQENAAAIAEIDVINSLAQAARRNRYVRPEITTGLDIRIKDGRHPVLENLLPQGEFIPNDTRLDAEKDQILIITGPNMAGKSTYIRQVALIILMAQMGSFVPAAKAEIGIVDRIFTRVGAADDIVSGMSTFMMEMSETANILNNATSRSLIILDEIGRGTSTFDGLSIAWATAEYLNQERSGRPKTLFATHYHELAELELMFEGIRNYNVSVKEWNDEVIFLYKLAAGSADHSYGIHVGRLAGLPKEVIGRAREILSNLEINSVSYDGIPSLVKSSMRKKEVQQELFTARENPLLNEIRNLEIDRISGLEALNLIHKWKENLNKENE